MHALIITFSNMQAVIPISLKEQWIRERIIELYPGANIIPLSEAVFQQKRSYHKSHTPWQDWDVWGMNWPSRILNVNEERNHTRASVDYTLSKFTSTQRRPGSIYLCSYPQETSFQVIMLSEC
jgi:hypothetical protein